MRILVVGAGALGGYFGGRLVEAERDVAFLVRPARAEQIARHGLRIESARGDAHLRPRTVLAGGLDGPYDLFLLAVKAYSLDAAMGDLAPAVGPGTAVLPVLNGVRHLDALASRFGRDRVLGGVAIRPASGDDAAGTGEASWARTDRGGAGRGRRPRREAEPCPPPTPTPAPERTRSRTASSASARPCRRAPSRAASPSTSTSCSTTSRCCSTPATAACSPRWPPRSRASCPWSGCATSRSRT